MPTIEQRGAQAASRPFLRRLFAGLRAQPAQPAIGPALIDLALAAGKDALHCAGAGWFPDADVAASPHPGQPILLDLLGFKRIELRLNPPLLVQRAQALQSVVSADNPLPVVWNAVRSSVRLFAGYYDLCPRDSWGHHRLIEAAGWGAYRTWYPAENEARLSASIASFFERSIVTSALTRSEGAAFVSGLAMERSLNQHSPHLLWSLLQRSQSLLFPSQWGKALTISPLTPDPTADALLEEILYILFRARSWKAGRHRPLRGRVRSPASWEWADRVEELAELLAPYIEPDSPQPTPFQPPAGRPQPSAPPVRPAGLDPSDLANPFATSDNQAQPDNALRPDGTTPRAGREQGPGIAGTFEQIDEYYSRQARSLHVKDDTSDEQKLEPEMLPVGFLDCAPASLKDLACSQIDWFRTRRSSPTQDNPTGLELHRSSEPLEIPADAFEPGSRDVPNLLLVVDSSSSMRFSPRATGTARGKYDVVLMACWGLFRYVSERGLGDRVQFNAINFSGSTRTSGWHPGINLNPVKRVLAAYEGGGTILGTAAIRCARESSPGRFLTITMTDGSLGNTVEALAELRRTVETGNRLVLLHIGVPNAFTHGVEALGGSVHILNRADELVGLCLDLAKANYSDGIKPPHR